MCLGKPQIKSQQSSPSLGGANPYSPTGLGEPCDTQQSRNTQYQTQHRLQTRQQQHSLEQPNNICCSHSHRSPIGHGSLHAYDRREFHDPSLPTPEQELPSFGECHCWFRQRYLLEWLFMCRALGKLNQWSTYDCRGFLNNKTTLCARALVIYLIKTPSEKLPTD